jgi:hypothetical protein
MSGNHVLRIFSAAPTHFRSQFSREFSARPQARVFKHRALRLEACEERNLLAATAVISAVVFGNDNNDGTQDGSEIGIDGVTLSLSGTNDLGTITPISAVTDSNGVYRFTSLRPGNYSVTDDFPAGYLEGLKAKNNAVIPASNATDTIDGITLADDQTASGNTFGEIPAVTIAGTVFADANNDGLQQGTELGLADVNISLVTSIFDLTPLATTTTLSDGSYSFGSLRPGTYAIVENDVTGFLHGQNSLNNVANSESNGTGFI